MPGKPPERYPNRRDQSDFEAVWRKGSAAVAFFDRIVSTEGVRMAAMLASQSAPTSGVDDRMVMANSGSVEETFRGSPEMLRLYQAQYRRETGEDLPADAVVYRGIVSYPGESGAIVTHKRSLQEVKEYLKARGRDVHGDWDVTGDQVAATPQVVRMGSDIMDRYKREYRAEGGWEKTSDRDLEEEILYKHAPVVTADDVHNAPTSLEECAKLLKR